MDRICVCDFCSAVSNPKEGAKASTSFSSRTSTTPPPSTITPNASEPSTVNSKTLSTRQPLATKILWPHHLPHPTSSKPSLTATSVSSTSPPNSSAAPSASRKKPPDLPPGLQLSPRLLLRLSQPPPPNPQPHPPPQPTHTLLPTPRTLPPIPPLTTNPRSQPTKNTPNLAAAAIPDTISGSQFYAQALDKGLRLQRTLSKHLDSPPPQRR